MDIKLSLDTTITIDSPVLKDILKAFVKVINSVFQQVVSQVVEHFADEYLKSGLLCEKLQCNKATKKSFSGKKTTKIVSPFGRITIPQLQVIVDGKRKVYITRLILGIEKWIRIPEITTKYLGLMGALAPLRVVNKFMDLYTGTRVSLMTIVRSIRALGKKIPLGIEKEESNEFEADGTGLPISGAGKRGLELKVFAQKKLEGGIRIAGMVIDSYKKGWDKLFEPLREALGSFKQIFLTTDGDTSILKGLEGVTVILQRCLFHIGHEMKYTLWEDKVKRKSKLWNTIMAKILDIISMRKIKESPEICDEVIKVKKKNLNTLIRLCKRKHLEKSATFLENAKKDMFSGIEKRIGGGTTSLIERVMRTINQRINVAEWSPTSALAVSIIRGAYYYNGFDV